MVGDSSPVSARATPKQGSDSERGPVPNLPRPPFQQLLLGTIFHRPQKACVPTSRDRRERNEGATRPWEASRFPSLCIPPSGCPHFWSCPCLAHCLSEEPPNSLQQLGRQDASREMWVRIPFVPLINSLARSTAEHFLGSKDRDSKCV